MTPVYLIKRPVCVCMCVCVPFERLTLFCILSMNKLPSLCATFLNISTLLCPAIIKALQRWRRRGEATSRDTHMELFPPCT